MGEGKSMNLNLLFIVMELLTILAYPIVFVYGKINSFSKSKGNVALENLLVTIPVARQDNQLEK